MDIRKVQLSGLKIPKALQINQLYTFFVKDLPASFFYEGEYHDFWELVICTRGKIGITGGKYICDLKAGECFFHRPMEFHNVWSQSSDGAQMQIITFSCSSIMNIRHAPYILTNAQREAFENLFRQAQRTFDFFGGNITGISGKDYGQGQVFVNLLENLLIEIVTGNEVTETPVADRNAQRYRTAVEVMDSNWDQRLTVVQIAELCGLGEANLKKIFKKYAGIGVMEYYSSVKTEQAKKLLSEGKSVRQTAELLGFMDQNYFCVFFKRQTGVSPSKYMR